MAVINEFKNVTAAGGSQAAAPNLNMDLNTTTDSKPVRVNSRDFTQATGSSIAMQAKPNQSVATTGDIIGAEFSPRIAQGLDCGALIGATIEPILKGTAGAGTVSDVRGIEVNLTDENVAGRTITNDVVAMNTVMQLANHTVSGDVVVLKVGANEGAQQWDYLFKLPESAMAGVAGTPGTNGGWLRIKVGATPKYIPLFTTP
jgi:hypothetical protein